MNTASPLRYPGGKSSMASLLAGIRRLNRLGRTDVAEPFAGGAGASLTLLYQEEACRIHINDADPAIADFWWTITRRPRPFLELLAKKRVSMAEWRRQRDVYRCPSRVSRLRRGFAAFYLNRCNRSGIIMNGGPIGGVAQDGPYKIDARFNKSALRDRIELVAEYAPRIEVSCTDGIEFIGGLDPSETFFFVDPPYFEKGQTLYLNAVDSDYHERLADTLHGMRSDHWVLTYDDCPQIRRMYEGWASVRPFSLRYVASNRRRGRELLITPKHLRLPQSQGSLQIGW